MNIWEIQAYFGLLFCDEVFLLFFFSLGPGTFVLLQVKFLKSMSLGLIFFL